MVLFFFFFWCTRRIGRKTKPPNGIAFFLSFTMRLSTFINKCIYNKKGKNTRTTRQRGGGGDRYGIEAKRRALHWVFCAVRILYASAHLLGRGEHILAGRERRLARLYGKESVEYFRSSYREYFCTCIIFRETFVKFTNDCTERSALI